MMAVEACVEIVEILTAVQTMGSTVIRLVDQPASNIKKCAVMTVVGPTPGAGFVLQDGLAKMQIASRKTAVVMAYLMEVSA